MKTKKISVGSSELVCQIFGEGPVNLVVEMGLGAVMAEWQQLARRLSGRYTVLLYQRAGYGGSSVSTLARTPENIAGELYTLLQQTGHAEKITLLAHSQGGLYAWEFTRMYPELVKKLVLLDPLSPEDHRFQLELTGEEFRKSGADKTGGIRMNLRLTRLHLGWLVRKIMRTAPPFYYYDGFSRKETGEILSAVSKPQTYRTALEEYEEAHDLDQLSGYLDRETFPQIPVVLITHNSEIACWEIQEFGGATKVQAEKIETLWQKLMQSYLTCASNGTLVQAKCSSHYIHLTEPELVCAQL
ncbi:MAG: alpha/beta hydrolase [Lachnospiraceae bacterium]|nr:alpha/beta hydrolase [Lachnospiraceae bacterium]MDY4968695.1 alpha/beta hydrolase [Lachnospiraceae bacterium]